MADQGRQYFVAVHQAGTVRRRREHVGSLDVGEDLLRRLAPPGLVQVGRLDGESWAWIDGLDWKGAVIPVVQDDAEAAQSGA
jgi:hypothetical protein